MQLVAGAAVVVGAVVGVVKYTGRDKDVEHHTKGVKGKLEKKGEALPFLLISSSTSSVIFCSCLAG